MQDISELERRIAAAFDRIDRGLEQADRARAAPAETVQTDTVQLGVLLRSLEAAQASSADWANRCAALEAQLAQASLSMSGEIAKLTEELAATASELALRSPPADQPLQSTQDLQDELTELRQQLAAQLVELTQLRAERATEIEELQSIVTALTPLIDEAKPHA